MKRNTIFVVLIVGLILLTLYCQKEKKSEKSISFFIKLLTSTEEKVPGKIDSMIEQTIKALKNRFALFNVKNVRISKVTDAGHHLLVEVPKKDVVVSKGSKKKKISSVFFALFLFSNPEYKLELRKCTEGPHPAKEFILERYAGEIPENMEIISKKVDRNMLYYLADKTAVVTSKHIIDGELMVDSTGQYGISFKLNNEGATTMQELSTQHIGKSLAVLLDGKLIFAPVISGPLAEKIQLTGHNINPNQAAIMAVLMKAGPLPEDLILPVPLKVLNKKKVITIHVSKEINK